MYDSFTLSLMYTPTHSGAQISFDKYIAEAR